MIIGISGYEANIETRVGIGRYAFEIINGIYECLSDRKKYEHLQVVVYLPTSVSEHMPKANDYWTYTIVKPKPFWTFLGLPLYLATTKLKPDLIFSPSHYISRFTTIPQMFSIMDMSFEYYPKMFKVFDLYKLVHWTKYSASHAKMIFTISEFSKNAIMKTYNISGERILVTYPGFTKISSQSMTKTELCQKYSISQNYILTVGTLQPRKNYCRLIEAFAQFLKINKQQFKQLELIIVGKKGWMYEDILSAPQEFGVSDRVKFLDYVPDCDLPDLYKNALCFTLPSLYEGFGLPVLEAMAYGCPVVVSSTSSLPEIAGKAGIYIDPENIVSISKGLLAAVRERNLLQGKNRIKIGLELVKKFSWDAAAKQTLETLVRLGGS